MRDKDILSSLASMSEAELREVRARAGFLLGTDGEDKAPDTEYLFTVIERSLKRTGLKVPPYSVFRRGRSWKKYALAAAEVDKFIREFFGAGKKLERMAAAQLCVDALFGYFIHINFNISFKLVVDNVGMIPEAVDMAYPGYAEAGMLSRVLHMRRRRTG